MGIADSKQKLGERVTQARKKLKENSEIYSKKAHEITAKSSKMSNYMIQNISNCLKNCSPFLEPTLLTAWYSDPVKTEEIVLNACRKVLRSPIVASEWDWFQQYVFPSSIWMFKSTQNENKFMYQELLEIASTYSDDIMKTMDDIYDSLKHQKGWNELIAINHQTLISRQDDEKVGLLKDDAITDLREAKTDEEYEMQGFIDSNWCLNSLLDAANTINSEFQAHIRTVMSPYGEFKPGPLKKLERCQIKFENDYSDAVFPKSAKLLDIVRCGVTFNTVRQLCKGYTALFDYISTNTDTLQIARVKNGFLDANDKGYRDIKINVVYRSPTDNINMITEVQLLLVNYLWEKKKIHKLYSVVRQRDYFTLVVKEEEAADQQQDPKDLKLVPAFNFKNQIKKDVWQQLYKCCIDPELGLLGVRAENWFGCVSLDTNEVIFEHKVKGGRFHSNHWIKVNGSKYLTVQTRANIISMYAVKDNVFKKDKTMQIQVDKGKEINFIEFDKSFGNVFLIIDKTTLQQRSTSDISNVKMNIELQEPIYDVQLRQLCLSDNGECCVIAGGLDKKYFHLIDLKTQKHEKLTSDVLEATYAPCFINGEGQYVAVGDRNGKIEIWDAIKKESFKVIDVCDKCISCTMSTSNILAVASDDHKIRLLDVRTWDVFYSDTFKMEPYSLHLTDDAKYLTIGGEKGELCLVWLLKPAARTFLRTQSEQFET
eukprot:135782_1